MFKINILNKIGDSVMKGKLVRKIIYTFIVITIFISPVLAQVTAIKAGKLVHPETGTTETDVVILVKGQRIQEAGTDIEIPESADVIDLSGMTVLPGLFDCHTHLCATWKKVGNLGSDVTAYFLTFTTADRAIDGVANARSMLESGFTVVRDVGNAGHYADVALKNAIRRGIVPGPTMLITGKIIAPFAGQMRVTYDNPDFAKLDYIYADTRDEIKKAIRENIHYGADWIKIVIDDQRYIYSVEDLKFIIEESAKAGLKVCAHCVTAKGAQNAVDAGIHSIEHGFVMNDNLLELTKEKDIWLVGTEFSKEACKYMGSGGLYGVVVNRLKRAYKIGVKMAYGSDMIFGLPDHDRGSASLTQLDSWVDAEIPSIDILRAITTNAAKLLNMQRRRGAIKRRMMADIIATPENPLDNIKTLKEVKFVMKNGKVIKNVVR